MNKPWLLSYAIVNELIKNHPSKTGMPEWMNLICRAQHLKTLDEIDKVFTREIMLGTARFEPALWRRILAQARKDVEDG